jgi:predicted small secreted protein
MKKFILLISVAAVLLPSSYLMAGDFTGSITIGFFESESKAMEQIKIPMIPAIQAAQIAVPGQVVKAKVDEEDSYLVYEIKILQSNGEEKEIYVDPVTGKILQIKED